MLRKPSQWKFSYHSLQALSQTRLKLNQNVYLSNMTTEACSDERTADVAIGSFIKSSEREKTFNRVPTQPEQVSSPCVQFCFLSFSWVQKQKKTAMRVSWWKANNKTLLSLSLLAPVGWRSKTQLVCFSLSVAVDQVFSSLRGIFWSQFQVRW